MNQLDPRTPVVVGVGQASERLGVKAYRKRSPVDLAADAAREALADTGADPAEVAVAIDTVVGVRQFENSVPGARAPLGRSDNYPRSVAGRIAASPARAVLETSGGQAPQHLVNEFAAVIAGGGSQVTLLFGSEAISTIEQFARRDPKPDFTEHAEGSLEDRGYGLAGMMSGHLAAHGLTGAPSQYALIDNARRARLKQTRQEYAAAMGALFAPFTKVAAANPHAAAPVERSAAELVTPTETNRPIADPYTRYIVAREKVNQGAAVLLTSVAARQQLLHARHRRDRPAGPQRARPPRTGRRQRRHHEQVLGRGVLHHPRRLDPRPERRPASRDRRLGRTGTGPLRRRPGHRGDLHRQACA